MGATIGIIGPGGGWCPLAERLHLFGDEAALPAIVRILALSRARTTAHVAVSADDLGDLSRDMRVTRCNDLMAALARADPQPGSAVWFSAEADQARAAPRHLLERGLDPRAVTTAGYWTKGRA